MSPGSGRIFGKRTPSPRGRARKLFYDRTARVSQVHVFRDLVKGLARRVIHRPADDFHVSHAADMVEHGVPPRYQEADIGK